MLSRVVGMRFDDKQTTLSVLDAAFGLDDAGSLIEGSARAGSVHAEPPDRSSLNSAGSRLCRPRIGAGGAEAYEWMTAHAGSERAGSVRAVRPDPSSLGSAISHFHRHQTCAGGL